MPCPTPFRVLITGASRGLGLGFVKSYASRPNTQVIATCRNAMKADELQSFVSDNNNDMKNVHSTISVLPMEVTDEKSISSVVTNLSSPSFSSSPSPYLNLLINNAGLATLQSYGERLSSCDPNEMMKLYQTNVVGPMLVTRAMIPLLKSTNSPSLSSSSLVAFLSSIMSSISTTSTSTGGIPSYRCSKSALNHLCKLFALEENHNGKINYLAIHPGWVNTDMGSHGGRKPPLSVKESVEGMVKQFDISMGTDKFNGKLIDYKGREIPY